MLREPTYSASSTYNAPKDTGLTARTPHRDRTFVQHTSPIAPHRSGNKSSWNVPIWVLCLIAVVVGEYVLLQLLLTPAFREKLLNTNERWNFKDINIVKDSITPKPIEWKYKTYQDWETLSFSDRLDQARQRDKDDKQRKMEEDEEIKQEQASYGKHGNEAPNLASSKISGDVNADITFDVLFNDPEGDAKPAWQTKLDDIRDNIAWAIPVGGPQPRDKILQEIIEILIRDGAGKRNIFIFEDDGSRVGGKPDVRLGKIAKKYGINLVRSSIPKNANENSRSGLRNGMHLAKHFRYFFDYLFREKHSILGTSYQYMAVIEDDLAMSDDCVKYFQSVARVMAHDPSIFCVSGRVDNGFYGTAMDEDPHVKTLQRGHFQFRRGNHFMAPGWMTSASVYEKVMRPMWLDDITGEPKTKITHWDNYMESRMYQTEYNCIFPEVPRLIHMGGGGFSVSKSMQRERFGNLRISKLPLDTDYGDLNYLTETGYGDEIKYFIENAVAVHNANDALHYRNTKLVIVLDAKNQADHPWNLFFRAYMGVFAVGGYPPNLFKQRGEHKGVAFGRWMTNEFMGLATFSPYYAHYVKHHGAYLKDITSLGCFKDQRSDRALPDMNAGFYPKTPVSCVRGCGLMGYKYAGVQNENECFCGDSYDRHGKADSEGMCNMKCPDNKESEHMCGGSNHNSVYESAVQPVNNPESVKGLKTYLQDPWDDATLIKSAAGQSCDVACLAANFQCDVHLFPLVIRDCDRMKELFGCTSCVIAGDVGNQFTAPGFDSAKPTVCLLTTGMYMRCDAVPPQNTFLRACVCRTKGRLYYET